MKELLQLNHVSKEFTGVGKERIKALRDVSLFLWEGETLGLVGESGCGKSTLARLIMGVYTPTEGEIIFEGVPLSFRRKKERVAFAKKAQMVFQDPFSSLNPRMTVEQSIRENLEIHGIRERETRQKRVEQLLEMVGLGAEHMNRFPHEFSGGQRQRIGIARALAAEPKLLICDEPISALDVSVQSQVMNLLKSLKEELGLTYLFIAHDLPMVRYISQRIAVMYQGAIMEVAPSDVLWETPLHPYTRRLMEAVLTPSPGEAKAKAQRDKIKEGTGVKADLTGCVFSSLCPNKEEICTKKVPRLQETTKEHFVACHFCACNLGN